MSNFESFSEDLIPRILPKPILVPVLVNFINCLQIILNFDCNMKINDRQFLQQDLSKPSVPEISILDDSNTIRKTDVQVPQSYKEWKQHQNQLELQQAKQQFNSPTLVDAPNIAKEKKKNVTFQSPTGMADSDRNFYREPNRRRSQTVSPHSDFDSAEVKMMRGDNGQTMPTQLNVSPRFEYQSMSPNAFVARDNESSNSNRYPSPISNQYSSPNSNQLYAQQNAIAHQSKTVPYPMNDSNDKVSLDDIYRLLNNLQLQNQATSEQSTKLNNFNQRPNQRYNSNPEYQQHHFDEMNGRRMPSHANNCEAADPVPSTTDLFNIVVKQQEQLMNIQKQIHMLLVRTMNTGDETAKQTKMQSIKGHRESPTNIDHMNRPNAVSNPIGLMTSLEINVQHCNRNKTVKQCGCKCECNTRAKYGHTSESDNSDQDNLVIPNANNGNVNAANWMFYGNVLNQVNEVLEKTPPIPNKSPIEMMPLKADNKLQLPRNNNAAIDNDYDTPNIRSAKVKQFGFQIDDVNISAKSKR